MQNSYLLALQPAQSELWQLSGFQIDYDPSTDQLVRICPVASRFLETNTELPLSVAQTKQALLAFVRRDWSKINQWLCMVLPQLCGTQFQVAVWKAISKIPAGQVATYQELAQQIGHPRAVRAVGTACGANPFPFLIPCHRVVAKHGMGGYGYSSELKRKLLAFENK